MDKPIPDGRYRGTLTFEAPNPKLPAGTPPPTLTFDQAGGHTLTASSAADLEAWALGLAGHCCVWCHAPTTTTTLDRATFRPDDDPAQVVAACQRCKAAHAG
jgi:hypothetical protein